jgi:hypothetical protein
MRPGERRRSFRGSLQYYPRLATGQEPDIGRPTMGVDLASPDALSSTRFSTHNYAVRRRFL